MGLAFHRRGQLREAQTVYREVLAIDPGNFDGLHLLGLVATQTGDSRAAVELLLKALAINNDSAHAHFNLGAALQQGGEPAAALASYARALAIDSTFAAAHANRGTILKDLKELPAALISFDRAIEMNTNFAEAYLNRGVVLSELGRWEDALADFDRALSVRAAYPQAHFERGVALFELGRFEAALSSYDQAIAHDAGCVPAHVNRGALLRELGQMQAALDSLRCAIAINPDDAVAHCNLGTVQHGMLQLDAALASYNRAIARDRGFAAAYNNRAYTFLLRGDLEKGWADLEWRWKNELGPSWGERRSFAEPLWLGQFPLQGKTILLHSEQGFGDTLQFCRYVRDLALRGANVLLEVPAPLSGLLAGLEGAPRILARGEAPPDFDCHCPLLSLPLAFNTTLATVPAAIPYLRSDPRRSLYWKDRLGESAKLRVGLVWSGGFRPNLPALWPRDARRNIPLAKLAPLANEEIEFFSLQKGQRAESELTELQSANWSGPTITDFTPQLHDFSDTAALIENLDLVISVDTAAAHLAGALGKPVWILNRFDTCWRWLLERTDSPWYPTARLYRQETAGDWDGVIARVRTDLRGLAPPRRSARIPR